MSATSAAKARRRLLYFPDLKADKGIPLHRTSIDRMEHRGRFPQRVRLSPSPHGPRFGRIAWWEDEVDAWLDSRPRGFRAEK
jgi:predicted DNA-binding transcriptional regulator AlpA